MDASSSIILSWQHKRLQKVNLTNGRSLNIDILRRQTAEGPVGHKLFIDRQNMVWLFDSGSTAGLLVFEPNCNTGTNIKQVNNLSVNAGDALDSKMSQR